MMLKWLIAAVIVYGGFVALALPGTALVPIFSRAPANGPVGGWAD